MFKIKSHENSQRFSSKDKTQSRQNRLKGPLATQKTETNLREILRKTIRDEEASNLVTSNSAYFNTIQPDKTQMRKKLAPSSSPAKKTKPPVRRKISPR